MDSWWGQFKYYLAEDKNVTDWEDSFLEGNFSRHLSDFLFSKSGSKYKKNFQFTSDLKCNDLAPTILVSPSSARTPPARPLFVVIIFGRKSSSSFPNKAS